MLRGICAFPHTRDGRSVAYVGVSLATRSTRPCRTRADLRSEERAAFQYCSRRPVVTLLVDLEWRVPNWLPPVVANCFGSAKRSKKPQYNGLFERPFNRYAVSYAVFRGLPGDQTGRGRSTALRSRPRPRSGSPSRNLAKGRDCQRHQSQHHRADSCEVGRSRSLDYERLRRATTFCCGDCVPHMRVH
jgi:hypothetical protein